jgi:hypothetical protein
MAHPYRGEPRRTGPSEERVREALRAWARRVPGAPSRLDEMVTAIEVRDQIVARVATTVVRRDLVERRGGPRSRLVPDPPTLDPSSLDPFAWTPTELRARTEHGSPCLACAAKGTAGCPTCGASGRARCRVCGGSGRDYSRSTRGAKCKGCRETGVVPCLDCSSTGRVACHDCKGTGAQCVWWEVQETTRTVSTFVDDRGLSAGPPELREQRFLSERDLAPFTTIATAQRSGPLATGDLEPEDEALVARVTPVVDPRLERVTAQQFVRFGAVCRAVQYEMCGVVGTVSLWGESLQGALTPDAVGPVRRRLVLLGAMAVVAAGAAMAWHGAFAGPTTYFARSNAVTGWVALLGVIAAVLAMGEVLRRLRPGRRFWPSRRLDAIAGVAAALAFAAVPVVQALSRPTIAVVRTAIGTGDLAHARLAVDALVATRPSPEVAQVADELAITEADRLEKPARIAELDRVAKHDGAAAEMARGLARAARLDVVREHLAQKRPAAALTQLDLWSVELEGAGEAPELRAQAYDQRMAACPDVACRFVAARAAAGARPTPARSEAVARARAALTPVLRPATADLGAADRLAALREAARVAGVLRASGPEPELTGQLDEATAALDAQLATLRLIDSDATLVEEFLLRPALGSTSTGLRGLDGVAVHVAESAGRCAGLYVVGATRDARSLAGKGAALQYLVGKATGRAAARIPSAPSAGGGAAVSRSIEGGTPIVARWDGDSLMELRIGAAQP